MGLFPERAAGFVVRSESGGGGLLTGRFIDGKSLQTSSGYHVRFTLHGSERTPDGQSAVNKDNARCPSQEEQKRKSGNGQYADAANGQTQRVPLSPNKTVAQQMLAALVNKNENAKSRQC